jgi:hypothetical protein
MENNEYLTILIHISGKYDPKIFFEGYNYPYKIIHEINTVSKTGLNKGNISEESFCVFEIGNQIEHKDKIKNAVELVLKIKNDAKMKRIKIEYFSFTLFYTGIQGNMELTKDELKWLRKLNCGINMNYIYEENK